MKRIRLNLTGVAEVVTEAAEKKLEKEESYQIPRCDNGLTEEQYEDLGIPLPQNLLDKLKKKDQGVELEDEDFEMVTSDVLLYEDQIKVMVTDSDFTTIFLQDGITIQVLETVEEIDFYLDFMQRSEFQKFKDSVSLFFRQIKNKFKKSPKTK